ncbi:MAG: arginine biosynthesis protein ArgJ, partial [Verrucomicrobiales bacterium]|nr:arginine biosynthesis protein ArgJ [Verrucomicrobiales bacterium]
MNSFHSIDGSITAPAGFLAAGLHCDVFQRGKASRAGQKRDLAVIVSEVPATAAGMFTTNQICAAPVKVCVGHIADGKAQAVVINSGNANACTGPRGLKDA